MTTEPHAHADTGTHKLHFRNQEKTCFVKSFIVLGTSSRKKKKKGFITLTGFTGLNMEFEPPP